MIGFLSGYPFHLKSFFIRQHYGSWSDAAQKRLVGTFGNSYFKNKILAIDYTNYKFLVVDSFKDLPIKFQNKTKYIPMDFNDNHCKMGISLGDTILKHVFYDTGSGPFDLITNNKRLWEKLTGKRTNDSGNIKIPISAWGQKGYAVGARLKAKYKPFEIADFTVKNPIAFYAAGFGVPGHPIVNVGNQPFAKKAVVVIDFIHKKIGVFKIKNN